jgi:hypothetical protein
MATKTDLARGFLIEGGMFGPAGHWLSLAADDRQENKEPDYAHGHRYEHQVFFSHREPGRDRSAEMSY